MDPHDTLIAGTALAFGAQLATRNTRHLDEVSLPIHAEGQDARAGKRQSQSVNAF